MFGSQFEVCLHSRHSAHLTGTAQPIDQTLLTCKSFNHKTLTMANYKATY